ncbi:MAG TPA: 5-(carboxyamino)imidazole ribonucleotide mutase [candidate division WOR-3 bacterium]|uniref:N5-carboxyaminoimidazole ribonucleotide mutase n=1 Tax=candidate division WOR-3 bacterium TaxID=2052148 RepID=A0A7C0ZDY0_UNCW3|nr:5-(carboxyamino)imidazole ribonucleotide mutase [candidate division WOR-3 bacterium]
MADILVVIGSKSDMPKMIECEKILTKEGVSYDLVVSSAHRDPEKTSELARSAKQKGYKVIIAAAGYAAALPGFIASVTDLPVIGVPLSASTLNGMDSLLSIVQMPSGVPVLSVGIDGVKNAAHAAIRILNLLKNKT